MLKTLLTRLVSATALTAAAFSAQAVVIDMYSMSGIESSGFGGWSYTYSAGSGTLNDNIIPTTEQNNQLFVLSDNPIINLHLSAATKVSSISIFGGDYPANLIPGTLTGWTTTIGASSAALASTDFGANCYSGLCNDKVSLAGTGLDSLTTSTITLSNFTGGWYGYFNIGEITVEGKSASTPEPTAFALLGLGVLGLGFARRRKV